MIACDPKYLHSPGYPDMSGWPFDVPIIMWWLKRYGFGVVNRGSGELADVFDAMGQRWMHRALSAEAHLRDSVRATELLVLMYEKKIAELK